MTTFAEFKTKHPDAAEALDGWYTILVNNTFGDFQELRQIFNSVDYVNSNYLVFNIKGGSYRLITGIQWKASIIYLQEFLTHKEYDHWTRHQNSKLGKAEVKELKQPRQTNKEEDNEH